MSEPFLRDQKCIVYTFSYLLFALKLTNLIFAEVFFISVCEFYNAEISMKLLHGLHSIDGISRIYHG